MEAEIIVSTPNRQLADTLLSTNIPEATQCEMKKYAAEFEQVFHVAIQFTSAVGAAILARLLYDAITKPGNKNTKINDRPVPQNVVQIQTLIINEIQQKEREKTPQKETDKEAN